MGSWVQREASCVPVLEACWSRKYFLDVTKLGWHKYTRMVSDLNRCSKYELSWLEP